jgi:hypothetical protein
MAADKPATMPERLTRIETLIADPDLGLIAHVTRIDRKVDDGLVAVNAKLDTLLEERAARRPLVVLVKTAGTGFLGALAMYAAAILLGFPIPKHS